MTFNELGLSEKVLQAVEAAGYREPTPIQAEAIPHVLAGRDVLGLAQTGTGKTASFTLPMLTRLEKGRARARMPRTLIVEPTRELAAQVEEAFVKYGVNHKLNVALLIGGVSFGDQDAKITRGVDVLIATPGRLLDHVERGKLLLTGIEVLVIDEADRMLDMGFIPDIERIAKLVPFTRQTLFFSATMPPEIARLTETFLHNPVRVEVSKPASTATTITQGLVATGPKDSDKRDSLRGLIRDQEGFKNAIIFCNRKREVAVLHRSLEKAGLSAVALHGDLDQRARLQALDQFRNGEAALLVASDVAARGLDIPDVSHVFNYDVPHHPEDYVHRIGRTGRAGRSGTALTLVGPSDSKSVGAIERLIGQPIPWLGAPVPEEAAEERPAGRRGGRPARVESSGEPRARSARGSRGREGNGEVAAMPRDERPEAEPDAPRPARERRPAPEERTAQPQGGRRPRPDERSRPARRDDEQRRPGTERQVAARQGGERPGGERQGRDRRPEPEEAAVIGLGDHVPSFLLRPTRPARAKSDA